MDSVAPLPVADESRVLSRNQNDLNKISDERFMRQLKEIQNLKEFLFEEKVKFDPDQMHSSYRRILVTDGVRRQRFELAI